MLIYNHKKEFLGIDESDLKALGLSNLTDLSAEAKDFADLFVKSPGFIHNFKHVHWIDYITCNDTGVDSKAIINVKGKGYTTNIEVRTIFLTDNPTKKAYIIEFSGLRGISRAQEEKLVGSVAQKPTPTDSKYENLSPNIVKDIYEDESHEPSAGLEIDLDKRLDRDVEIEEEKHDLAVAPQVLEKKEKPKPVLEESLKKPLAPKIEQKEDDQSPFAHYVYDPAVASSDLGLPVDLVEEFIQDFIAQAESFKKDLYDSASSRNMDHLKIQSHKLKGVAANLRIEDALDALTIINSSDDDNEIKTNLDRLYRIISRLSNKEDVVVQSVAVTEKPKEVEEDFILSFKDESFVPTKKADKIKTAPALEIDDSDVPASIDIPELADDDFLKHDAIAKKYEDEAESEELLLLSDSIESAQDEIKEEVENSVLHYDKKKIAHDIGLDLGSFNELFEDYLNETKELAKSMNTSVEKNDLYGCRSAAIKLKGMSENMRIHDFDSSLEAIINSSDMSGVEDFVRSVTSKLNLISKAEGK
ncbi:Hpt domain-containing protein [Sulfurimonas sp.]|uniref:Hpt domain-containing protein n=1 Tax=Sulfurimonas sp. TaxID=2022749 RepID=UPI0025FAE8CC|nr:Hpt domain-containing protein [Sulfurimonas sp.]MBW6487771.1 Hpt domain-containing protein [Sulfurimonas sp.]